MYKVFYAALTIFWVLDVCNMPFMQMFDTTYPINELFWILVWILLPSTSVVVKNSNKE